MYKCMNSTECIQVASIDNLLGMLVFVDWGTSFVSSKAKDASTEINYCDWTWAMAKSYTYVSILYAYVDVGTRGGTGGRSPPPPNI